MIDQGRRRHGLLVFFAGMLCLGAVACSTMTRYEVLTFFFDGVPPPPGVEPAPTRVPEGRAGASSAFIEGLEELREKTPRTKPAPVIKSVHKPVAERKCQECHNDSVGVGNVGHDAGLCDKCHLEERQENGWDHGPINLGTCIPCHVAHKSVNEHLLSKPVPELCLNCHNESKPEDGDYHTVVNFADCTACHDPHKMY